jgi:COMPASS component SPP1
MSSRAGSKYCSDECGIKLATNRIYEILPQRIQQWNSTPCAAETNDRRQLENIRKQQEEARLKLQQLETQLRDLENMIIKSKKTKLDTALDNADNEEESEMSIYCITCGHEIGARTAARHLEKCFNKYESQTSFGSAFKTRIEANNMFCDVYNHQQGTYCKRLRVLCPEHSKDPKISDDEVCGCPLLTGVFQFSGEFCRMRKKKCMKHYNWEKLRRAEVDMERVNHWLKLDELFEQERTLRNAITNRAGVLALMLHSTVNHDLMQVPPVAQQH